MVFACVQTYVSVPPQGAGGVQGDQGDGGTGNWRGMLKKGEDGMSDRSSQSSLQGSPLRGHAVNLLDVVRTDYTTHNTPLCTTCVLNGCFFCVGHSLSQCLGSCQPESNGTVRS